MDALVLTVDETAEALKISPRMVYALIGEGVVPVVKLGTRKVVPVDALRRMIEERTEWSPETAPGLRFSPKSGGEAA